MSPPSVDTFRRALARVDAGELDQVVGAWLFDQVRAGRVAEDQVVIALDGKSLRGSLRGDGSAVHLFSAMVHGDGVIVAQAEVDGHSNEITAFKPLLEPLDIEGCPLTADALHTQREHARFVVEDKRAHYLFQVKANQPTLLDAVAAIPPGAYTEVVEDTTRGHGRIEHRYIQTAAAPDGLGFPHAAQVVKVYRERYNTGYHWPHPTQRGSFPPPLIDP